MQSNTLSTIIAQAKYNKVQLSKNLLTAHRANERGSEIFVIKENGAAVFEVSEHRIIDAKSYRLWKNKP